MKDPDQDDENATDEAIQAMGHDELVALLNRLYETCGEPSLSASTARASSDDELRDRIRGVRRRLFAKAAADDAGPVRSAVDRPRRTPPRGEAAPARRVFVVLVSDDQVLARRARASCAARGVVLVWVASPATLAKLVTSVTPTHVVIEGQADRIDDACLRELAARGARLRRCRGAHAALETLAAIE